MRGRKPTSPTLLTLAGSRRGRPRRAGELGRPAASKGTHSVGKGHKRQGSSAASAAAAAAQLLAGPAMAGGRLGVVALRADCLPDPPDHLYEHGRKRWQELLGLLVGLGNGMVTSLDLDQLALYCQAYDWWVRASRRVNAKGMVSSVKNGSEFVSPWVRVVILAAERLDKSGSELGLSPTARARLKMEIETQQDDLLDYLTGGGRARVPATKG